MEGGQCAATATALELEATVDDIIDFAGDIAVSTLDANILYDYRD